MEMMITPAQLDLAISTSEIALKFAIKNNNGNIEHFRGVLIALYFVRDTADWTEAIKRVDKLIMTEKGG